MRISLVLHHNGGQYIRKGQQYSNVNILRLAIGFLNATINRYTRIPEPEIRTDGSSETRQHWRIDGYGSGFGPPRCSRSGFWKGLDTNRTVLAVRSRTPGVVPGPVANTTGDQPGSADDKPESTWEHLGAPATNMGALATCLGAHQITVVESWKNNICFGNAADAHGNHSYYFSFNDF